MTKESYEKLKERFFSRPEALDALKFVYSGLPVVLFCIYPLLVAVLFLKGDARIINVISVPAAVFFLINLIKKLIKLPRPYEVLEIEPLIKHEEKKRFKTNLPGFLKDFWRELPKSGKILFVSLYAIWLLFILRVLIYMLFPPSNSVRFSGAETAGAFLCLLISVEPVIPDKMGGDSFPSRHTAAATAIAAAFLYVSLPLGLIVSAIALLIGASRLASGAHFPRDVIAGAALSIIVSIVGFVLI